MIWYRQVLHVAVKDLRQAKRALAFYYGFIGFELAVAAGFIHGSSNIVTFFGIPLTLYVAALIVQGDSAVRADAFWVTRPLAWSAVIAAKVLAVVVGMAIPAALAQLTFYEWLAMQPGEIAPVVGHALIGYASLLMVAMLIATFTPNGRSFLAGLIILVIASSAISSTQSGHDPSILLPTGVLYGLDGVALLCCAFAIIDVYHTRNRRRGRFAAVSALALGIGLPFFGNVDSSPYPPGVTITATAQVNTKTSQVNTKTSNGLVIPWIDIRFSVPRLASDRPVLSDAEAHIELPDGHRERIYLTKSDLTLHEPATINDSTVRWLSGEMAVHDSFAAQIPLSLTDEQIAKLSEGARVRIIGTMNIERTRVEATLPLVRGAVTRGRGIRYQFDSVASSGKPQLQIRSWIPSELSDVSDGPRSTLVLLNSTRREGVRMTLGSGEGTGVSLPLFSPMYIYHSRVVPKVEFPVKEGAQLVDAEWMRGGRLEFLQWTPVRSYPVNIRVDSIALGLLRR